MCGRLQDAADLVLALHDPILDHDGRRRGTAFAVAGDTSACDALLDFIKKAQTQGISVASPVCATACASRELSHYTT